MTDHNTQNNTPTNDNEPKPDPIYTPQQAADWLACSREHIYRLIRKGVLPAIDISPPGSIRTKTRIRERDLVAYVDQHAPQVRLGKAS